MFTADPLSSEWQFHVAARQSTVADLLRADEARRRADGYFHTLTEILQQPATWLDTCNRVIAHSEAIAERIRGIRTLVLTGSGSSEYVGDCVRLPLQSELGVTAETAPGGSLITGGSRILPPPRPGLMVSIARSGDSPESAAALALMLEREPEISHLVITCNRSGKLAKDYKEHPRVTVVVLDDATNDRSLVMTSSFTNLALAARSLGCLEAPADYRTMCARLSSVCGKLLETHIGDFAAIARTQFARAVFLGSGSRYGAAREAALKMLEMTAGRVPTVSETYLGLRHGPMSFIHPDTLVVCFLSSDPLLRAYEADLIRELDRKHLAASKLIIGDSVPRELLRDGDTAIELTGAAQIGDENVPLLDVVCGQLLAFFRCREEGLKPDSPSEEGVISRVVEAFTVHQPLPSQS